MIHARQLLAFAARAAIPAALFACALAFACSPAPRCGTCGMKIDAASPFVAYLVVDGQRIPFDTPRCAFTSWRGARASATEALFREYYSQELKPAGDLLFVSGSDVVGPMGPDLVPIETARARRFALEHNGAPPRTAQELRTGDLP
jgi:copper chaperone NosL